MKQAMVMQSVMTHKSLMKDTDVAQMDKTEGHKDDVCVQKISKCMAFQLAVGHASG